MFEDLKLFFQFHFLRAVMPGFDTLTRQLDRIRLRRWTNMAKKWHQGYQIFISGRLS